MRTALEEDEIDKINEKINVLAQASMKIGEAMYTPDAEGGADATGMGSSEPANDTESNDSVDDAKVVDGQFKDVSSDAK